MCHKRIFVLMSIFLSSLMNTVAAQSYADDLTELSLEDLMNIEVYSASKMPERFFDTAAAVYVITPEDIRRSGVTTIPELLRMVPGLNVQQINSHSWDISARGFNGSVFANKLLVIMDGRAVYSPLFGGVLWELQDTVLEDIDRIEVIRGPGGSLWGANAVNGVINIITKKAKDTQGGLFVAGAGTEERGFSTLRYGAKAKDWHYRTYVKYFNRDEGFRTTGTANDQWQMARTGFRGEKDEWTVQGDYYQGYLGQRVTVTSFTSPFTSINGKTSDVQGGNFLTRYQDDHQTVQGYWQATDQSSPTYKELRNIFDLEYTRHQEFASNQEVVWGAGYRLNLEKMDNSTTLTINKPERTDQVFSLFAQDTISLIEEKLKFTLGTKLEHNTYTDFEVEPNARLSYKINDKNLVWGAVSRAIRTPSRLETDVITHSGANAPTQFTSLVGSRALSSEEMRGFELGYRTEPMKNMFFDLSVFADHYEDLTTFIQGALVTENGFPVQQFNYVNGMEAESYGLELAGDIKLREWWRLKGAYTFSKMNVMANSDVPDIGIEEFLQNAVPRHNAYVRSSFDLPHGFDLDVTLRYMDSFQNGSIPSNTQMDINLIKTFNKEWELAFIGQNLFRDHHRESFGGVSTTTTQIERSAYVKVTHKF